MDVINNLPGVASIRFLTGPLAGSTFPINKPSITIGREQYNDIVISDPSVSRQHARLVNNGTQWSIEKLSPQNVVTVNSRNVQQAIISDRDTIGLGTGSTFLFLTSPASSASGQRPAAQVPSQQPFPTPTPSVGAQYNVPQQTFGTQAAPSPAIPSGTERFASAGPPATTVGPSLEVSSNVHADKQIRPLNKQVINIGRDPSNDIVINDLVISAFHAQIVREGNQFVLVHPHPARGKTLNGLLYQGRHIAGDQPF